MESKKNKYCFSFGEAVKNIRETYEELDGKAIQNSMPHLSPKKAKTDLLKTNESKPENDTNNENEDFGLL